MLGQVRCAEMATGLSSPTAPSPIRPPSIWPPSIGSSATRQGTRRARSSWIRGPWADLAVAWCWIPFAAFAHVLQGRDGNGVAVLFGAVLLFSFTHQPLTLALVYGNRERFRIHRSVFSWSPLVFLMAALVGTRVSFALVAVVAGLWNAEHTLMQRFGVTRIYGRKGGDDHGTLERWMLLSWLALALVWGSADSRTPRLLERAGLGGVNGAGVDLLVRFSTPARLVLGPLTLAVSVLAVRWVGAQRRSWLAGTANPAKWAYVGATAVLFAVMLVDPIAGLIGYVGAHAAEYFVVVHGALPREDPTAGPLGRLVNGEGGGVRWGRCLFFAAYALGTAGLVLGLRQWATPLEGTTVLLTLGGLHVFYDGFIWKLRRPAVAAQVGAHR